LVLRLHFNRFHNVLPLRSHRMNVGRSRAEPRRYAAEPARGGEDAQKAMRLSPVRFVFGQQFRVRLLSMHCRISILCERCYSPFRFRTFWRPDLLFSVTSSLRFLKKQDFYFSFWSFFRVLFLNQLAVLRLPNSGKRQSPRPRAVDHDSASLPAQPKTLHPRNARPPLFPDHIAGTWAVSLRPCEGARAGQVGRPRP
jgi:hypothetical protein